MRTPENIRTCVAYIGYVDQATNEFVPIGSVFFVGRDNGAPIAERVYAVTAKHVIDRLRALGVEDTCIRMNMKMGNPPLGIHKVPINEWFSHPLEQSIDVSLVERGVPVDADHLVFPLTRMMNAEKMKEMEIGLGDEIFIVGLFRHHAGNGKNIPIIRTGNLAALDEEKVLTKDFGAMDAFLVEARSIGGLSGSPVILNLGYVRSIGGQVKHLNSKDPMYLLLGLIHGHYDADADTIDSKRDKSISEKMNTGIAIVTPYYNLLKVISAYEQES